MREAGWRPSLLLIVGFLLTNPGATVSRAQAEAESAGWSYWTGIDLYLFPDEPGYVQPIFTADHGALHLEGRYNYEDLDTGTFLIGRNFFRDADVEIEVVPMLGAAAGLTDGIVPALSFRLAWSWLEFQSDAEYVFDLDDRENDFFFAWTELSVWPSASFRVGFAEQRTHVKGVPAEANYGLFVGLAGPRMGGSFYSFRDSEGYRYWIVGVDLSF